MLAWPPCRVQRGTDDGREPSEIRARQDPAGGRPRAGRRGPGAGATARHLRRHGHTRAGASRIPVLAAASFATATQSFVFAGLLAELAADLDVTVAAAGQLGTAYALAFGVSAPLVAAALARVDRRRVMVGALLVLALLNLLIVAVTAFPALVGQRVAAGIASARPAARRWAGSASGCLA